MTENKETLPTSLSVHNIHCLMGLANAEGYLFYLIGAFLLVSTNTLPYSLTGL
jgi:hypothetical protein